MSTDGNQGSDSIDISEDGKKKFAVKMELNPDYKKLLAENENLKTELTTVAEKELNAKLQQHSLKLSDYDSVEEALEALKNTQQKAPEGGTTAPLNENQLTGKAPKDTQKDPDVLSLVRSDLPVSAMGFATQNQMVTVLKEISRNSSDPRREDAKAYLQALAKKELKKSEEFELVGSISEFLRKGDPKIKPTFRKISEEEGA